MPAHRHNSTEVDFPVGYELSTEQREYLTTLQDKSEYNGTRLKSMMQAEHIPTSGITRRTQMMAALVHHYPMRGQPVKKPVPAWIIEIGGRPKAAPKRSRVTESCREDFQSEQLSRRILSQPKMRDQQGSLPLTPPPDDSILREYHQQGLEAMESMPPTSYAIYSVQQPAAPGWSPPGDAAQTFPTPDQEQASQAGVGFQQYGTAIPQVPGSFWSDAASSGQQQLQQTPMPTSQQVEPAAQQMPGLTTDEVWANHVGSQNYAPAQQGPFPPAAAQGQTAPVAPLSNEDLRAIWLFLNEGEALAATQSAPADQQLAIEPTPPAHTEQPAVGSEFQSETDPAGPFLFTAGEGEQAEDAELEGAELEFLALDDPFWDLLIPQQSYAGEEHEHPGC